MTTKQQAFERGHFRLSSDLGFAQRFADFPDHVWIRTISRFGVWTVPVKRAFHRACIKN